ncbi:Trimeric intracellular cation channel type B-A [Echinococcus granulosus]|uniref:Trimeric intracellular cation channel type B-A n=2 Tax=Echinococcus granulosus TaxID=6210 RepID=W6UTZ4_ECHGR|nr:Trimeric intracellular cation channel type B-A [Echinococcus granulosus]EUB61847.1 Trimeric intracellular cation channel type B-A [Echinococcus granulosus]
MHENVEAALSLQLLHECCDRECAACLRVRAIVGARRRRLIDLPTRCFGRSRTVYLFAALSLSKEMDPQIIDDIATSVSKWSMYPYFDIAHYTLMSTAVREDIPQSGSGAFSRKHPFACWFATMLMCFGGAILGNFILGEPIFSCFDDHRAVLTATAVWYLINYSPFDVVYKIYSLFSVRLLVCAMKEVQRSKKISLGVSHAYHDYPHSAVTCILVGLLKGTGYLEMKIFARLVRGVWLPASTEFLHPSFTTKISLLSAIVFYYDLLDLIPLSRHQLFLAVVGVLVYMRVAMLCLGLKDPFAPIQNLICTIFFGGVVDALKAAVTRRKSDDSSETVATNPNVIAPNTGVGVPQDGYSGSSGGGGVKESSGATILRRNNPPNAPHNADKKRD